MNTLPDSLFRGVASTSDKLLKIFPGQTRDEEDEEVIINDALWYNHTGQYLSHGDLTKDDFLNIWLGLNRYQYGPFVVVPQVNEHRSLKITTRSLAECCSFIIHPLSILVIDGNSTWTANTVLRSNVYDIAAPVYPANRDEALCLFAKLAVH